MIFICHILTGFVSFLSIQAIQILLFVHVAMPLEIVSRAEWNAKPPKESKLINKPVPFVIIHHSDTPAACFTGEKCIKAMQSMQQYHQDGHGWDDIGYNFGIGGDGKVYEGRGFNKVGAHAPKYNDKSIGIVLIGNWEKTTPPENMLQATKELIAHAIESGYLSPDYILHGHRQVRATTCPGDSLFNEIKSWPHFGDALFSKKATRSLEFVSRSEWGAKPPKHIQPIGKAVPYVIIHHSASPGACYTKDKCTQAMQSMQRFHQNERGWDDIGYNFAIGGDAKVYEGRGFNRVGAHAPKYNDKSIGICLIGNWQDVLPPKNMLELTKDLITYAIESGYLLSDYTLYGHRQVTDTECPGKTLFNEIKTWPHFKSNVTDLS